MLAMPIVQFDGKTCCAPIVRAYLKLQHRLVNLSRGVSLIRMPRGMVHHNTDFSQSLKTHMHSVLLMDLQAPMEICHGGDVDQEHNNTIIQLASQSTCIV